MMKVPKVKKIRKRKPYMWCGTHDEFGVVFSWAKTDKTNHISFRRRPFYIEKPGYVGFDYDRNRWVVRPYQDVSPIPRIAGTWRYKEFGRTVSKYNSKRLRKYQRSGR